MIRWFSLILLLLISVWTFNIALDDQGSSIADGLKVIIVTIAIVVAVLTSVFGYFYFKRNKTIANLFFCFIPLFLFLVHTGLFMWTQQKINKDYFLLAINPDEDEHQFEYYFRVDSTLKTHGIFFWSEANDFQNFKMRGDTIFLDKIIKTTGIQSKVYLKTILKDTANEKTIVLIPLDDDMKPIENLTRFNVHEDKTTNLNLKQIW